MSSTFILPGDPLPTLSPLLTQQQQSTSSKSKPLRLGPGLLLSPHDSAIKPYRAGTLHINPRKPSAQIISSPRRYTPTPSDAVLVTLIRTTPEAFIVQLTPHTPLATIPFVNFSTSGSTNATARKTRPNFTPGVLIYARVDVVHKHLEAPELSVPEGEGWGEVKGGFVFDVSARMGGMLLDGGGGGGGGGGLLLEGLGKKVGFEMIVGRNGRCWVDAKEAEDVWRVSRVFREYDDGGMWGEGDKEKEGEDVAGLIRRVFGK